MDESYHDSNSLSSRGYSDIVSGESRPAGVLRPYESINTPVITLILYAIIARCRIGGCITPGIRQLATWAGVSQGVVSQCLYDLARDGWISYDGRVIMLLRDPDRSIDQNGDRCVDQNDRSIDQRQSDRSIDRSFPPSQSNDRSIDRFEGDMVLTTTNESESKSLVTCYGGMQGGDHHVDRLPPAAQLMAELGANPIIIRDAYESRPDWTAQQVRARWEYDQKRIAMSDGKLMEGVFFTALRCGELAPARPDPDRPLAPESYAADPAFLLGSQAAPDESAQRNAVYREAHWRAVDLLGPGAAFGDMRIVVEALVAGASDAQALEALRSAVLL